MVSAVQFNDSAAFEPVLVAFRAARLNGQHGTLEPLVITSSAVEPATELSTAQKEEKKTGPTMRVLQTPANFDVPRTACLYSPRGILEQGNRGYIGVNWREFRPDSAWKAFPDGTD